MFVHSTDARPIAEANGATDTERLFRDQYGRIVRTIAGITHDPGRAEELAVEVFLRWASGGGAAQENPEGWLHRTAIRLAIDELRRTARRQRYDALFQILRAPTPEQEFEGRQEKRRIRVVLASLRPRDAELLVMRTHGFSYEEIATAIGLAGGSVGTLLSRAQAAFRKEYVKRYGER